MKRIAYIFLLGAFFCTMTSNASNEYGRGARPMTIDEVRRQDQAKEENTNADKNKKTKLSSRQKKAWTLGVSFAAAAAIVSLGTGAVCFYAGKNAGKKNGNQSGGEGRSISTSTSSGGMRAVDFMAYTYMFKQIAPWGATALGTVGFTDWIVRRLWGAGNATQPAQEIHEAVEPIVVMAEKEKVRALVHLKEKNARATNVQALEQYSSQRRTVIEKQAVDSRKRNNKKAVVVARKNNKSATKNVEFLKKILSEG